MNDLDFIRSRLESIPISELEAVADEVKMPFGTLHKIKYGKTKFPRFDTVKKLTDYFKRKAA